MIDGGNSNYRDDQRRARRASALGIHYVDCGTSGGVWGLERGYAQMVGGDDAAVRASRARSSRRSRQAIDAAPRTPGREGDPQPGEDGWLHCGPPGAGHFVKMVHNGIEYGLMAAYAEGLNILEHANAGAAAARRPTRRPPRSPIPTAYLYDLDLPAIAEVWRRGSVIASWLLDLTAAALVASPQLDDFSGRVSDSGRGPLDGDRGDRGGRAGADPHRRAVRALRVAGRGGSSRTS